MGVIPTYNLAKKGWQSKNPKKAANANLLAVNLAPSEAADVQNDTDVAFVESDSTVEIASIGTTSKNDPSVTGMKPNDQTVPWGIHGIGADLAIQDKSEGQAIKVAVLDTGIANHPDLRVAGGISFVDGITSYVDDNGHGTHVAGTIAATDNKFGVVGAAPKTELFAVKVLDRSGSGNYSQVIQGIDWAISNKVDIISMSFGAPVESQALHQIIQEANRQGILLVAAAGNGGAGTETEMYPARYPEVVSVGAVTPNYNRASFSSTGTNLGLVAPGYQILSTTADGQYGVMSGTSMAAPHVTGAAAALWSKNRNLTNQDIKNKIYQTATPLGEAHEYGHGLVNVAYALGIVNGPVVTPTPTVPNTPPPPSSPPTTTFDIAKFDNRILEQGKELLRLKEAAIANSDITLAKKNRPAL